MDPARNIQIRLFITAWLVFSLHFATNIVREHYPAFSLVEKGTFQVDDYEGFHSDIFKHTDGHAYIGNQVAPSVVAAVPLLVFDPLLDELEEYRNENPVPAQDQDSFETEYPRRRAFLAKVRKSGLDLRFGGSAVVTSVFLMAPLLAGFLALLFGAFVAEGISREKSCALSILAGFATPIFYRSAHLNHNVFLMLVIFGSFALLWRRAGADQFWRPRTLAFSGVFAGLSLAFDYAGVVPLLCFFAWIVASGVQRFGWRQGVLRAWPYVAGTVPPVVFLLFSQWKMFGDPFLPGQFWMPEVNYTDEGWRGFGWPSFTIFWRNLMDWNWGLLSFAPLLVLGFIPARVLGSKPLLTGGARWASLGFVSLFLLFCSANHYSLMQWNSGFRYLLPIVPFVFLHGIAHLRRLSARRMLLLGAPFMLHSWVLTMVRFTPVDFDDARTAVGESWNQFLTHGVVFPWLTVLRGSGMGGNVLSWWGTPLVLVVSQGVTVALIWRPMFRAEKTTSP